MPHALNSGHYSTPDPDDTSMFAHITHTKKRKFLEAYAEGGSVREAAASAGCAFSQHGYWYRTDTVYAEAFEEADKIAGQLMKDEARRRAMGYYETAYTKDGVPYEVFKCSDVLLMFRLKARFPAEFRDNYRQKDGLHEISALLARVLLEMHERETVKNVTPEAGWEPLPPRAVSPGAPGQLPPPPDPDTLERS